MIDLRALKWSLLSCLVVVSTIACTSSKNGGGPSSESPEVIRQKLLAYFKTQETPDPKVLRAKYLDHDDDKALAIVIAAEKNPHQVDSYTGMPLLVWASIAGYDDVVRYLLSQGVNMEEKWDGRTALEWAINERHYDVMEELIQVASGAGVRLAHGINDALIYAMGDDEDEIKLTKKVLAAGANPNYVVPEESDFSRKIRGRSVLMVAAIRGYAEVADVLLKAGANIEAESTGGYRAIHYAAKEGRERIIGLLLKAGADPDGGASSFYANSPVVVAINNKNPGAALQLYRAGATLEENRSGFAGANALVGMLSNGAGHSHLTRYLLERVSTNSQSGIYKTTALIEAAKHAWGIDTINRLMVEHRVNTTLADVHGRNALMYASYYLHPSNVELLLQKGRASELVQAVDSNGDTALTLALHKDTKKRFNTHYQDLDKMIRALVRYGSDINHVNKEGKTILMKTLEHSELEKTSKYLIARGAKLDFKHEEKSISMIRYAFKMNAGTSMLLYMLEEGADVAHRENPQQSTLLMAAVRRGSIELVKAMLATGKADVNAYVENETHQQTALIIASTGKPEIVEMLLKQDTKMINHRTPKNNYSALMWAARKAKVKNVELLIEYNADPRFKSNEGNTAKEIAKLNYEGTGDITDAQRRKYGAIYRLLSKYEETYDPLNKRVGAENTAPAEETSGPQVPAEVAVIQPVCGDKNSGEGAPDCSPRPRPNPRRKK